MSAALNLILFKAKPDAGTIIDFEILFMSASSQALYAITGKRKHKTLLKDLPDKKQYFDTYILVAENEEPAPFEMLQQYGKNGQMIRSTLWGQGSYVMESWEILPATQKNTADHEGVMQEDMHHLKEVLDAVPQSIYITKPITNASGEMADLEIVISNKNSQNGNGIAPAGKTLFEIFPDLKSQLKNLSAVFETGNSREFVVSHTTNGVVHTLNIVCARAENQLIITEHEADHKKDYDKKINELNKELVSKNRELKYLNSELRTFNTIAANDYKESLKRMYTALEYIITHDSAKLSNEGKANLRRVQSGIQRMKLLTEDIISFGGLVEVTEERTTVNPADVTEQVKAAIEERSGTLDLTIEYKNLTSISGYPTLLYLLFYHLIDNAIKFRAKERPVHLAIECLRVNGLYINHADASPDTSYDLINISDNGIGFDPELTAKLFTMFYRVDKTNKYKGSGTGLAYCRKIMQLHDGFITAQGIPGEGAVFSCYFPVAEEVEENIDS